MDPCTYEPVLLTAICAIPTSMQKISERLKLWLSSHMLMYPHLQVQDASSGSVESMRSALVDPLLLTQQESITCQSSAGHLDLLQVHRHVQNDGDEYRDEEIPDEDFWVSLASCAYSIFAKSEH